MNHDDLKALIEPAFEDRAKLDPSAPPGGLRDAVEDR